MELAGQTRVSAPGSLAYDAARQIWIVGGDGQVEVIDAASRQPLGPSPTSVYRAWVVD
jgi:hypothetical protein